MEDRVVAGLICLECNTLLISKAIHDFQKCKCPNEAYIDGGGEYYYRTGAMKPGRTIYVPVTLKGDYYGNE